MKLFLILFVSVALMSCHSLDSSDKPIKSKQNAILLQDSEGELPPDAGFSRSQRHKRFKIIDVHCHIFYSAKNRVYKVMKENGLTSMVNMSGGNFDTDISQQYIFQKNSNHRVFNFYTPNWRHVNQPGFGKTEATMLEKAVKNLGYKGLKISKAPGLYLRDKKGKIIPVDSPIFYPLWEKAGELGVPVLIHTSDPEAFWLPADKNNERYAELKAHPGWSFYGKDIPPRNVLLKQRENIIKKFPNTVFIGAHFGNNPEHPEYIAHMFDTYPNFYVDLAARIPEIGRHNAKQMRKFFIKYQDRIMFGTDIGIGPKFLMLGSSDGTSPPLKAANDFYDKCFLYLESNLKELDSPTPIQGNWKIHPIHLPISVLEKIYYKNARNLVLFDVPDI